MLRSQNGKEGQAQKIIRMCGGLSNRFRGGHKAMRERLRLSAFIFMGNMGAMILAMAKDDVATVLGLSQMIVFAVLVSWQIPVNK